MDGTIDRPSDTNMSFKHYLPSLCSPVVAVADPSEKLMLKMRHGCQLLFS